VQPVSRKFAREITRQVLSGRAQEAAIWRYGAKHQPGGWRKLRASYTGGRYPGWLYLQAHAVRFDTPELWQNSPGEVAAWLVGK